MATHVEKIFGVRVGITDDMTAMIVMDGKEESKIVIEAPREQAQSLVDQMIAAGFSPNRGKR